MDTLKLMDRPSLSVIILSLTHTLSSFTASKVNAVLCSGLEPLIGDKKGVKKAKSGRRNGNGGGQ